MTNRTCEQCGAGLQLLTRRHARYCSTRCRVAAHRARRRVPGELTGRARWVRHTADKVPLTVTGRAASSTDPDTWATYEQARGSSVGAGLGCVLVPDDDVVCIDLDHALDGDGAPKPWAAALLARAPRTWIEVSPSGDGLHIWGHADMLGGRRLPQPDGGIEIYGSGRYITVTGRPYANGASGDLGDLTELVAALT
jgi:primase-polymerase (primpol)-like protein